MKLAWLVWREGDEIPEIHFSEPSRYHKRVQPIVYAEIQE